MGACVEMPGACVVVAVCEKSPGIACGWVLLLLAELIPPNVDAGASDRAVVEFGKRLASLAVAACAAACCDCDCG